MKRTWVLPHYVETRTTDWRWLQQKILRWIGSEKVKMRQQKSFQNVIKNNLRFWSPYKFKAIISDNKTFSESLWVRFWCKCKDNFNLRNHLNYPTFIVFQTSGQTSGDVSKLGFLRRTFAAWPAQRPPSLPLLGHDGGLPVCRRRMWFSRSGKKDDGSSVGMHIQKRR